MVVKKLPYEVDIGKAVAEYLTGKGWEVYPEVALHSYHGSCDIVAVKPEKLSRKPIVLVVECKRGITCQLVRQLWRWRKYANMLAVGVPERHRMWLPDYDPAADFEGVLLDKFGMGMFGVGLGERLAVLQDIPHDFIQRKSDAFLEVIDKQHKNATPGMVDGKRFTALDATLRNLAVYVKAHNGCSLHHAVRQIRHHYSGARSAHSALAQMLKPGCGFNRHRAPEVKLYKYKGGRGRWYCEFDNESRVP